MPIIDTSLSTLAQIRTKVRRLTRSPSVNQLTDQQIDDYVNTFVLYDFPQHLRLFSLRKLLTFYTNPNIDTYENNTVNAEDPMYNFINRISSVHGPIYIAGVQAFFTESRNQFYKMFTSATIQELIGTGNGVNFTFSGTLSYKPIQPGNVMFTSIGANNEGSTLIDKPTYDPISGLMTSAGTLEDPTNTGVTLGNINYVTGVYNLLMPIVPALNKSVYCQSKPYTASKPTSVLFFDNKFVIRPIPDQVYKIEVEIYVRPTELLLGTSAPELAQWWQYIAYGTAKKVFEDRLDQESIQLIMPEYKQQELLVLRQTILLMANDQSATIFNTPLNNGNYGSGFNVGGF
jgi:hypothetical protein